MSLADLYRAIKTAKKRPRAIAVSTETWNSLKKAGVVEMVTGHSLVLFRKNDKFPVLQGDITILVNPALDIEKKAFVLPSETEEAAPLPAVKAAERRRSADRRKGPRRKMYGIKDAERRHRPERRRGPRRKAEDRTPRREADDY